MTSQSMKNTGILLLLAAFGLSGCGGDEQTVTPPPPGADVFYSYPYANQANVSVDSPVLVRVSSPVTNATSLNAGVVELSTDDGATIVPATAEVADNTGGKSIVVRPDQPLSHDTEYRVEVVGLKTEDGLLEMPGDGFDFRTRPQDRGPRSERISDEDFAITRTIPDGDDLPIMDFSAFRFQFSQPVDEQSVEYGTTLKLEGPDMAVVEAAVVTRGRYLTVDPVEDLDAGRTYTLTFTQDLESIYGTPLQAPFEGDFSQVLVPKESGPTEKMTLNAPAGGVQSPLTGDEVNLVPVKSTLVDTESQQGGDLTTELAFVPNYPDATPIRIPRGTVLEGDSLGIQLGGIVDVGFDSGDLAVKLISDASGYLLPNPYSNSPRAPRMLRMFMDIGVTTGDARAHAGFSQDVLHLEVVGKAIVENGELVGDGFTVVETDILGVDYASGPLSFHMNAYRDQVNAPEPVPDEQAPEVKSWMPGLEHVDKQRPGDPILITFDEPLAADTLEGNISLLENGAAVTDFELEQEGSVLILRTDLDYDSTYSIELSGELTDLSGNHFQTASPGVPEQLSFTMPSPVTPDAGNVSSPFVFTAYPGYPCVTTSQDLANGHAGRCLGGMSSDDRLPIADMPANREIRVHFSHPMDEASLANGFKVEEIDASGTMVDTVGGQLDIREQEVSFMPDEPWEEGTLYRYTLASNGQPQNSSCDPASMICSEDGLPLKTRRLAQDPADAPATNGGGADMEIVFRGAPATDTVFAHLDLRNTADLNANGYRYGVDPADDEAEGNAIDDPELVKNSIRSFVLETEGSIDSARSGCPVGGQDCPERKYAYFNGALNVEIIGPLTASEAADKLAAGELKGPLPQEVQEEGGVLFYAYPTMVQASNLVAFAETSDPLTSANPADTGPMIMRVRHMCDARANAADPNPANAESLPRCEPGEQGLVESWIVNGDSGPEVISTLDNYLDAPELQPELNLLTTIEADHEVYSLGLSAGLQGPVTFFDDGRMQIAGINQDDIDVDMELSAVGGFAGGTVRLRIPAGGVQLSFLSEAPRR